MMFSVYNKGVLESPDRPTLSIQTICGHSPSFNDLRHPNPMPPATHRPKEDSKGKRKNEEEEGVPEELLAALNFAALEGSTPPWAAGAKNWDPENGGLTERHIQVRACPAPAPAPAPFVVRRGASARGLDTSLHL